LSVRRRTLPDVPISNSELPGKTEEQAWITRAEAAAILGCSIPTVDNLVHAGLIKSRPRHGPRPSIDYASTLSAREHRAEIERKRAATRAARDAERASRRPPEDEHVWLSAPTTAALLGVTRRRVAQLASADRIPHVNRAGRLWFRRDHIELFSAARARRRHEHTAM